MNPILFAQFNSSVMPRESLGLFNIMQKGGPIMWFILIGSVVAAGVFIERQLYYRRVHMRVGEFLAGILNLLHRRDYDEALERCDEGFGPVVNVVRTAILKRNYPPAELREIVRESAQLEIPRLEANLTILSTIGYVSPLLGLLGTVTGMIETFTQIGRFNGAAPVGDLATGIWTALITTAAGLVVAIPCYVAYNYLVSRLNSMIFDLERAGIEVIHALIEPALDATTESGKKSAPKAISALAGKN